MKWFFNKLGLIGSVFLGLTLVGGAVLLCVSSIPVAIAAGVTYAVIGLAGVTFLTGSMYFSHQHGVSQERQRHTEALELARRIDADQQQINALEEVANGATQEYNIESNATVSRTEFLAWQATVLSQGKDIRALQQTQSKRFQAQALYEVHREKDKVTHGRTQDSDSDSDSSDTEIKPMIRGRNNFFHEGALDSNAANEQIGVNLRRRNNPSH